MHVSSRTIEPYPTLAPRIPLYPEVDAHLDISRSETLYSNDEVTLTKIGLTHIGSEEDDIIPLKLSDAKYVLLLNPAYSRDPKQTIIESLFVSTLGKTEPEFVTFRQCNEKERAQVEAQLREESPKCVVS